ncbi:MAG TPA: TRAM domain-containing protein [Mycobacteriales bacterium]|nr:TRAM domain-containing protein [Mycobacteriales bacterium]
MSPGSRQRPPTGLIEILRLLTILFFAGLGYETSRFFSDRGHGNVLGPFNGLAVAIIVGSGIGFVVGGVFGRTVAASADRTEAALREVSADTLLAGALGLVCGVLTGGGIAWPLFFVPDPLIAIPLFGTVVAVLGYLGFRIGASKRDGVLAIFGGRTGVAPRVASPAALPHVVDSSVAIDGRILDVVRAGFLHGRTVVAASVLGELQGLADASDPLRRSRGRRGLELLEALQREPAIDIEVLDDAYPEIPEVDAKLVRICLDNSYALLTLDTNLAKAAGLAGVRVLNLHALSLALRPPVVTGEDISVQLIKAGREPGQAVGYLDDGTMVVVEGARRLVGRDVTVRVTSVVTTSNGRLVFAHPAADDAERSPSAARGRA